MSNNYILHT